MKIRNFFVHTYLAVGLLAITNIAIAGFVDPNAIILDKEKFEITPATSSLAYNPGTFTIGTDGSGGPSPTVNYQIGGSFDVTIWTSSGSGVDWLTISNFEMFANQLPSNFQTPDFENSIINGSVFAKDSNVCSNIGGGVCVILLTGSSASISGELQNGRINFNAFVPVSRGYNGFYGGSTYQINATSVVPIPAAFWLFTSAIGFFGIKENRHFKNKSFTHTYSHDGKQS